MRRRDFILLLGAAPTWPVAVGAQQPERVRRIGVLMTLAAGDQQSQRRIAAFVQGLEKLGWTDGRNMRIDYRWSAANAEDIRKYAVELAALAPDVILAAASPAVGALLPETPAEPNAFV